MSEIGSTPPSEIPSSQGVSGQVEPQPQPMSESDRLLGALFDPGPAFADIARRPRFWAPLVLLVLVSIVSVIALGERIGWQRVIRQQIESNPRSQQQLQQIPAERRERIFRTQVTLVSRIGMIGGVVGFPLIALILAGAFTFVFSIMADRSMRFGQVYAITCYALLPWFFHTAVAVLLMFLKEPADYVVQNPVSSNLGAFLDPNTVPLWLLGLGNSLDVFSLWTLLLLPAGFAAAQRKLTWASAFRWVMATWVLFLVAKTGFLWILG